MALDVCAAVLKSHGRSKHDGARVQGLMRREACERCRVRVLLRKDALADARLQTVRAW